MGVQAILAQGNRDCVDSRTCIVIAAMAASGIKTGKDVAGPDSIKASIVCQDPPVYLYEDFVTPEEVQHLIELAGDRWGLSTTSRGLQSELLGAGAAAGSTDKGD